jgi:hypothetical protein
MAGSASNITPSPKVTTLVIGSVTRATVPVRGGKDEVLDVGANVNEGAALGVDAVTSPVEVATLDVDPSVDPDGDAEARGPVVGGATGAAAEEHAAMASSAAAAPPVLQRRPIKWHPTDRPVC